MFLNSVETIYLKPKTAIEFGLINKTLSKNKKVCSFCPSSINENSTSITVNGSVNNIETKLKYEKQKLTKKQKVFIAWAYLLSKNYENNSSNKNIASEYIKDAIQDELDSFNISNEKAWALPYYLISRYSLDISGIPNPRINLYKFLDSKKPLFTDFYKELLRQETNPIRKTTIAKIAEKYYPEESWFIDQISDDLYHQGKYRECIDYLLSVKNRLGEKKWLEKEARVTLWKCYIEIKEFKEAMSSIQGKIPYEYFSDDFGPLLRGITIVIEGKKYEDAITEFEQVIFEDYTDNNLSYLASYYLIKCFLEINNRTRAVQTISLLRVQEDTFLHAGAPFNYSDQVIDILEEVIKSNILDVVSIAKAKGVLAYFLEKTQTSLTTKNREKVLHRAVKLSKESLRYFSDDSSLNALHSNLLYLLGNHDKAMDYKIKSFTKGGRPDDIFPNAELNMCSSEYLLNYPKHIEDMFGESNTTPEAYIENYGFDSDVGILWKHKLFQQIAELYLYIKKYISNFNKIGEISEYTGGGLFEIAYSLGESGMHKEAQLVYEKYLETNDKNTAVLNNLAIEYEKTGDLKKARKFIKNAYSLHNDDDCAERNYKRLCKNKSNKTNQRPKSEMMIPVRKSIITFDNKKGEIILGKKRCEIPFSSNQYQLCKELFLRPYGEWLDETDVVDNFYKGNGPRCFYDSIRLVNSKAEKCFGIKNILTYKASRVRIRI